MSRVGKQPVALPSGVQAQLSGKQITIKGPKGQLSFSHGTGIKVSQEGQILKVVLLDPSTEDKQSRANFGTARAILNGMVFGVTTGWKKSLEMNGVGFTAKLAGQILTLATGYSHETKILVPKEVKCVVNKTTIELESCSKEILGTLASRIRRVCPPEPYLGKGIKYSDEKIRRKAGKTGKK